MTIGNFRTIVGSNATNVFGNDPSAVSFFAESNNNYLSASNLDIIYSLNGDDDLSTNPFFTSDSLAILVGGRGGDEYLVRNNSSVIILDLGDTENNFLLNDTISADGIGLDRSSTFFALIDNERHLYAFDTISQQYMLLPDWKDTANFIETVNLAGSEIYDFTLLEIALTEEINNPNATNSSFLGDFTWEQLQNDSNIPPEARIDLNNFGLSPDTIDSELQEIVETNSNFSSSIQVLNVGNTNGNLVAEDSSYVFQDQNFFYDFYALPTDIINVGDVININLSSVDIDPVLFLLDSQGNVIDFNDDNSDSLNANLTFRMTTGEPLFVSVETYDPGDTGNYTLTVDRVGSFIPYSLGDELETNRFERAISLVTTIETRDSLTGALTDEDLQLDIINVNNGDITFRDEYLLVDGNAGEQVSVTLESDFDGVLVIQEISSSQSNFLTPEDGVDTAFAGGTETFSFTIGSGLDYVIFVQNFDGDPSEIGDYTLSTEII